MFRLRLRNFVLLTISIVVWGTLALAQPAITSVSGALADNSALTIRGANFGTKPTAAPVVWDTFEKGTVGNQINGQAAVIGSWDNRGYTVKYSSTNCHSGSKCADHPFTTASSGQLAVTHDFSTIYIDFWGYLDNVADNLSRNWKIWRVGNGPNNPDPTGMETIFSWYCQAGQSHLTYHLIGGSWDPTPVSQQEHLWYHFEVWLKQSDPGMPNGSTHQFINGQMANEDRDNVLTRTRSADSYEDVVLGELWQTDAVNPCPANSGAHFYTDDIYIDSSWARVVVGDHSTWATSTHREIQVPSAWSTNSITITQHQGSFDSISGKYLYVVDSNGKVNANGFLLSSQSGGLPVQTPANVSVR